MTQHRPLFAARASGRGPLLSVAGILLLVAVAAPLGLLASSSGHPGTPSLRPSTGATLAADRGVDSGVATSIAEVGAPPTQAVVGTPTALAWQAVGPTGERVTTFAAACEFTVALSSNGSSERAWVNATPAGPLSRASNGTFAVPSAAWDAGRLNLTVSVGSAFPVTVRLFGPSLPALPLPVAITILPDLDHLVLYAPLYPSTTSPSDARANATFWHVRDRFGDPTPGAFLVVTCSNASASATSLVPVGWTTGGTTGAWVNYSVAGDGNATVRVSDAANATLLGPISIPALVTVTPAATSSLSPIVLVAVVLLVAAALVALLSLIYGGRPRPLPAPASEEEELRRLAEGRATIVELVRRAGELGLSEIESAWEPAPAPPVLADWLASLVTDGTLTATVGEGGRARFAIAPHAVEEPKVTFDEGALDREIARRDAAVGEGDRDDAP